MPKICNLSIAELLESTPAISSPPEIVTRASELINDATKTAKDIGAVIDTDPGLTARLLQIVNSAFYGFPTKILSVSKAVTIIGTQDLYQLILTTMVVKQVSHLSINILSMDAYWSCSLRCGLYGKALADEYMRHHDLDSVFVSGLLHNIGRLILCHKVPEFMRSSELLMASEKIEDFVAEQRILGFDRFQVGAAWAEKWRFPEIFTATMENHSQLSAAHSYILESNLVYIANSLSRVDTSSDESLDSCLSEHASILNFLGITAEMVSSIIPTVESDFHRIFSNFFGESIPPLQQSC